MSLLRDIFVLLFCALLVSGLRAEAPILVRSADSLLVTTWQGLIATQTKQVTAAADLTVVILAETLDAASLERVKTELPRVLSPLLRNHPLRVVNVLGVDGEVSDVLKSPTQVTLALKRLPSPDSTAGPQPSAERVFSVLAGVTASLPADWAHCLIIGRFPVAEKENQPFLTAWLSESFRSHRSRVSFWALDGVIPEWAANISAATLGAASEDIKVLQFDADSTDLAEATWQTKLGQGFIWYRADLKTSSGTVVASVETMTQAASFVLPPLADYLAARRAMQGTPANALAAANGVLKLNPSDTSALRHLAAADETEQNHRAAANAWRALSTIDSEDPAVWAGLGRESYASGAWDESGKALRQAKKLSAKDPDVPALLAKLRIRNKDYEGALPLLEEALAATPKQQDLWLLLADCGRSLDRWSLEAESLEQAVSLGNAPFDRRTELIATYLAHEAADKALPHLTAATKELPANADIRVAYAGFWEAEKQPQKAEEVLKSALDVDPASEPACYGLALHYLKHQRPAEALKAAGVGLQANPSSVRLAEVRTDSLEATGDIYGARHLASTLAKQADQTEALRRWAHLEDLYGNRGAEAYLALVRLLVKQNPSQAEVVAVCRRGLAVAIRCRQDTIARDFADRLAAAGDASGLALLGLQRAKSEASTVPVLGGVDSLYFLAVGKGKTTSERFLMDYSRALVRNSEHGKSYAADLAEGIHRYFTELSAVSALGTRTPDGFNIVLSLNNKADRQRTERVLHLLGLKLTVDKGKVAVQELEGKSQAKKQDAVAALGLDEGGIQQALASGKAYQLQIPQDSATVFPAEEQWHRAFYDKQQWPGLIDAFAAEPRMPQLYVALNSMDRAAAELLIHAVSLKMLADKYGPLLARCSSALALSGKSAELPGGEEATPVWRQLVGTDPRDPSGFFVALMNHDNGLLLEFFSSLAQLDMRHQRFFTRSVERTKRFYDLFRESADSRHADAHVRNGEFVELLGEVPLDDDNQVDFPGSPEVWSVASGQSHSANATAHLNKKLKAKTTPAGEDEILVRLAKTKYKEGGAERSEAANFIAIVRLDSDRTEPLDPDSALLLAQNFARYGAAYPYLASLTGLTGADFQNLFGLGEKILGYDSQTANLRSGQLQAFLELLCLAQRGGVASEQEAVVVYRAALRRYATAGDASAWTLASLSALDDLSRLPALKGLESRDIALRTLLLGKSTSTKVSLRTGSSIVEPVKQRETAFQKVLSFQKVPPVDALFAIQSALQQLQVGKPAGPALESIAKNLELIVEVPIPKTIHASDSDHRLLTHFHKAGVEHAFERLREKASKRNVNRNDVIKAGAELMDQLEHTVELAMAGLVYARFLDPSDLIVSDDPLLLRKHIFVNLTRIEKPSIFQEADFDANSEGAGSRFTGGFSGFSMVSARARTTGNHTGGANGAAMATAILASARATDWRTYGEDSQRAFAARVRLAQEWLVQSAVEPKLANILQIESRGLLSLSRRKTLLAGLENRDWSTVWDAVSLSDLYFLGESLLEHAPAADWSNPNLAALRKVATSAGTLDALGQVAPTLNGCSHPHLHRFQPYEDYEPYLLPGRISERSAELKLTLAWLADSAGWPPEMVATVSLPAADLAISKLAMRDIHDWRAALDAFSALKQEQLETLALVNP